jgi:hypothetical protein
VQKPEVETLGLFGAHRVCCACGHRRGMRWAVDGGMRDGRPKIVQKSTVRNMISPPTRAQLQFVFWRTFEQPDIGASEWRLLLYRICGTAHRLFLSPASCREVTAAAT